MTSSESTFKTDPDFIVGPKPLKERMAFFGLFSQERKKINHARRCFIEACEKGDLRMVEHLIDRVGGVDWKIKVMNYEGLSYKTSPLIKAIQNQNMEVIEFLLQKGADPSFNGGTGWLSGNRYPFSDLIKLDESIQAGPILSLLLAYGLDKHIHETLSLPHSEIEGNTLLHWAMTSENAEALVPLLLSYGADPLIENKDLKTPLLMAEGNLRTLMEDAITRRKLEGLPESTKINKNKNHL